jgi:hypothetical protein
MTKGGNTGRTVSVFQTVRQAYLKPEPFPADSIIKGIIAGAFKENIEPIRAILDGAPAEGEDRKAAKKEANELKNKLPAIAWAGQLADRKKLQEHSGLLCIDIDGTGAGTRDAIGALRNHPSVYAAFMSPSGNGVKVVFRVPTNESRHASAWRTAA